MTFGAPQRKTTNAGIYVGAVTALDGTTAYVEVPRLAPGYEYPARFPAGTALEAGDEVAVAFLEGGRDELVVLVRLA